MPDIKHGLADVSVVKLGTTAISKVMHGTNLIWQPLPPHLVPTVGIVSTPDPGLIPTECVVVAKFYVTAWNDSINTDIVYHGNGGGSMAWRWAFYGGLLYAQIYPDAWTGRPDWSANSTDLTNAGVTPGHDIWMAVTFDLDNGAGAIAVRPYVSTNGTTYTPIAATTTQTPNVTNTFDTADPLRVGGNDKLNGRIYWAELRSGLNPVAGTIQWRFDAAEYPGTGLSYVDPRGKTWTLSNASAIVL